MKVIVSFQLCQPAVQNESVKACIGGVLMRHTGRKTVRVSEVAERQYNNMLVFVYFSLRICIIVIAMVASDTNGLCTARNSLAYPRYIRTTVSRREAYRGSLPENLADNSACTSMSSIRLEDLHRRCQYVAAAQASALQAPFYRRLFSTTISAVGASSSRAVQILPLATEESDRGLGLEAHDILHSSKKTNAVFALHRVRYLIAACCCH